MKTRLPTSSNILINNNLPPKQQHGRVELTDSPPNHQQVEPIGPKFDIPKKLKKITTYSLKRREYKLKKLNNNILHLKMSRWKQEQSHRRCFLGSKDETRRKQAAAIKIEAANTKHLCTVYLVDLGDGLGQSRLVLKSCAVRGNCQRAETEPNI